MKLSGSGSFAPGCESVSRRSSQAGTAARHQKWNLPTLANEIRTQIVGLASVASAWPNLPETVQRQIVTTASLLEEYS